MKKISRQGQTKISPPCPGSEDASTRSMTILEDAFTRLAKSATRFREDEPFVVAQAPIPLFVGTVGTSFRVNLAINGLSEANVIYLRLHPMRGNLVPGVPRPALDA